MKHVHLPGSDLRLSRLSFGTARLYRIGSIMRQVRHLLFAADAGFTHFDTSPLYGFGSAEVALGKAFKNRSSGVTVATKVGLYPPVDSPNNNLRVHYYKMMGKVIPAFSKAQVDWGIERASKSLTASLNNLGRDYIDILFMHEPVIGLIDTDEWETWRESELRRRVGAFGVAGLASRIEPFIVSGSELASIVQVNDSLAGKEADVMENNGRELQLTYGYLSSASRSDDPIAIVRSALKRNRNGSIVVSSRRQARVVAFKSIAECET